MHTMPKQHCVDILGDKWWAGKGAQEHMYNEADRNGDTVYLSSEYLFTSDGPKSRVYRSYKNWDKFLDGYYPFHIGEWHVSEMIRQGMPCKVYFDLDWPYSRYTEKEVIEHVRKFVQTFMKREFMVNTLDKDIHFKASSFNREDIMKGSLHCVVGGGVVVKTNTMLKDLVKRAVVEYADQVVRDCVDWKVYTKNRIMRLVYSTKLGDPIARMFSPVGNTTIRETLITYLDGHEKKIG